MADCVCVRLCMCVCVASLTWRWLMLPGLVGEGLGDFPEWGVDSWLAGVPFTGGGRKKEKNGAMEDETETERGTVKIDDAVRAVIFLSV